MLAIIVLIPNLKKFSYPPYNLARRSPPLKNNCNLFETTKLRGSNTRRPTMVLLDHLIIKAARNLL